MATYTPLRPFFLPDAHLPNSASTPWECRTCTSIWPCETAGSYLTEGRCQCGSPTYWEKSKPRRWHTGPRCYSHADQMAALAEQLHQYHQAHPHYPPSRPAPPKRRRRQRPPYAHTPSGPGDIRPGTWLWVKLGGLHPAWGDIHRLAMLTHLDRPYCEVWLDDTTVHRVRPHLLVLERTPVVNAACAAGVTSLVCGSGPSPRPLLPQWRWLDWTLAEHIEHVGADPEPQAEPVQEGLFATSHLDGRGGGHLRGVDTPSIDSRINLRGEGVAHTGQPLKEERVFATPTIIDAITVMGAHAPECDECEGGGTVTYLHGPHERTRECDTCHGTGRYLPCPACVDGTSPGTGDTCPVCEGFTALT